jgi:hypothetical protein
VVPLHRQRLLCVVEVLTKGCVRQTNNILPYEERFF